MTHFCDIEHRAMKEVVPGINIRTFWGEKMMLISVNLDANTTLPSHSHPHEQAGTVMSAMLELTIAGETRQLHPGDAYIIPGGVEHSARTGDAPTVLTEVFSPVREDYKY